MITSMIIMIIVIIILLLVLLSLLFLIYYYFHHYCYHYCYHTLLEGTSEVQSAHLEELDVRAPHSSRVDSKSPDIVIVYN